MGGYNWSVEDEVRQALEEKVRPAVRLDGGDLELVEVKDGVVTVRLLGACEGCPISPVTLKAGIERILKEQFPEISEVVAIEA